MRTRWKNSEERKLIRWREEGVPYSVIAERLGRPKGGVESKVKLLIRTNRLKPIRASHTEEAQREIIIDGYPDVPWWCRISTRDQHLPVVFNRGAI